MRHALLLIILFSSLQCFAVPTAKDVMLKTAASLKNTQSISYKSSIKTKNTSTKDSIITGTVALKRAEENLFGGKIWLSADAQTNIFYDAQKIYTVDKKSKKAKIYDASTESAILRNSKGYNLIWQDFFQPSTLEQRIRQAQKIQMLKDTTLAGRKYYRVMMQSPGEHSGTYYIDQENYLPYSVRIFITTKGSNTEQNISNIVTDKVSASRFSLAQIPGDYKKEVFDRAAERKKPLEIGTKAPGIAGKNFEIKLQEKVVRFEGKVTLLNFWFMACGPCASAFEQMKKIQDKYQNNHSFQICGINSIDNDSESLPKVPGRLGYHKLLYSQYMVDESITQDAYHVFNYPTFYLVDKHGNIAYTARGYSDSLYSNLTKKIDELLK